MKNLRLRHIDDCDHPFLVDLHNDPQVLQNITNPQPITLTQHLEWWNNIKNNKKELRLIFTVDDEAVGLAKFYNIDVINKNCVLGADIHKDHRGKGYAHHMWSLMLHKCFNDLMLHRVSLTTAEYNVIGQKVYKKLGFKEEGRLVSSLCRDGKFYDQILMYMLSSDWDR